MSSGRPDPQGLWQRALGRLVATALVAAVLLIAGGGAPAAAESSGSATPARAGDGGAASRSVAALADEPAVEGESRTGACTGTSGVTVVVDLSEFGGPVRVRCAPGSPASGFAALTDAGFTFTSAASSQGFLCRIDGQPVDDPCLNPSPATAYWSYWVAPRGGSWCYSNLGAGARRPPAGTVEGWSFARSDDGAVASPPGIAPPAPSPGTTPVPLNANDCDAQQAPPPSSTTTTTVVPSTTPPPQGGGGSSPWAPTPTTTGPVAGDAGGAGAANDSPRGSDTPSGSASPPRRSTTTTAAAGERRQMHEAVEGSSDAESADSEDTSTTVIAEADEAAGDRGERDQSAATFTVVDDDGSNGGFPTGMVVGGALIGALGAGALVTSRRRAALAGSEELSAL